MRIIAGKYRSRKIAAPSGEATRPTSDRLRETLFNVLAARCPDSVWIDCFAGSGAVGLEAFSRGARQVYFLEQEKKALRAIRANLQELEIDEGYEVLERDALAGLRQLDGLAVRCDVCFVDPPWSEHGSYAQVLGFLSQSQLLADDAVVVAEHEKHFDPGEAVGALVRTRKLRQGDAVLSFYRRG